MIFEQLYESQSGTYTYLLADEKTREAVLIDPVLDDFQRYVVLLEERDLKLKYTFETHVHADHITAAAKLRERFGSCSVLHEDAGVACADKLVRDGDQLHVGDLAFTVLHTPGHTDSDVSYLMGNKVFTGDTLLIGGCGRTDFQQGDAGKMYDSITYKLYTLPSDTVVYPGHDYHGRLSSTIESEKQNNQRINGDTGRQGFIQLMTNLDLPQPSQIDKALPANTLCGRDVVEEG